MTRFLPHAAFAAGLAAIGWVGAGYVGANPLALAVTVLIAAFYLAGAAELHRFRQATATLASALSGLSGTPEPLGAWLDRVPATLRPSVRLRIESGSAGLPGPALTPYLAGLLVLLGMLGTFLGMVVTLQGTGLALEGATDLQAIRASLSAPVKGLGLAFGTSVAGIAASAMLGLMSALCRRERLQAVRQLDAQIATTLRPFSAAHQREASLRAMQHQADLLAQQAALWPGLADRLQQWMATMEQQHEALNQRLADGQDRFHRQAEATYSGLASSVDQSLKNSLAESARLAGAAIQPAVEATMAGLTRQAASLHDTVAGTVQAQVEQLATRFADTTTAVATTWQAALAEQRQASDVLARGMQQQVEHLATRFGDTTAAVAGTWNAALSEQRQTQEATAQALRTALDQAAADFSRRTATLVDGIAGRLEHTSAELAQAWQAALAQQEHTGAALAATQRDALASTTEALGQQAASLLATLDRSQARLRDELAAQDAQRLAGWTQAQDALAASLQQAWREAGEQAARQQGELFEALARTAAEVNAQTQAHARETLAEIDRLVQAAAQAPQAAAEVIDELRGKLSDSVARDNAMLEERSRILATLSTLLDAVNHASTEQRGAIDALVSATADLLERAGARFTQTLEAETGRMSTVAAQVSAGAAEVASLGEAFGTAVQLFGQTNDRLVAQLQRIEGALGKSMARSDEQLAYYVAQAREVIDLSISSQQRIIEDLQQIAARAPAEAVEAAA